MPPSVLHAFPRSATEPGQRHLGSTKDYRGRTQYFADRQIDVDELVYTSNADDLLAQLAAAPLESYDAIFVETSISAAAFRLIRRRNPAGKVFMRSINAEALHRLHWIKASGGLSRSQLPLVKRTATNFAAELSAGWYADAVLSISPWDAKHYYSKFTRPSKVRWLPFFLPDSYLAELQPSAKEMLCVCLSSTIDNPLIRDSVERFEAAVAGLNDNSDWKFVVTGQTAIHPTERIQHSGVLNSPGEILASSRVVALLSDYGYGFKTKILEAVVAGNFVLVPPRLWSRLPRLLDPWCFPVDASKPGEFGRALTRISRLDAPSADVNAALRSEAYRVLDDVLSRR